MSYTSTNEGFTRPNKGDDWKTADQANLDKIDNIGRAWKLQKASDDSWETPAKNTTYYSPHQYLGAGSTVYCIYYDEAVSALGAFSTQPTETCNRICRVEGSFERDSDAGTNSWSAQAFNNNSATNAYAVYVTSGNSLEFYAVAGVLGNPLDLWIHFV